jgi:hypothetical protein
VAAEAGEGTATVTDTVPGLVDATGVKPHKAGDRLRCLVCQHKGRVGEVVKVHRVGRYLGYLIEFGEPRVRDAYFHRGEYQHHQVEPAEGGQTRG